MFARSPPRTPHRTNKQQTREENDAVAPPAATIAAASASSFAAAAPSVPSAPGRLHVSLEIGRSPKSLVSCGERAFEAKLLEWLSRQRQGGSRVSSGTVPTQIEAGICRFSEGTIPPPAQLASDILSMRCEITREPEGDADLDSDDEDDAASVRKQEEDDAEFDLAEPSLVGLTQAASVSFAVYTLMDEEPQVEEIQLGADDGNNADAQSVPAGLVYDLPHRSMDALWSNLFYPSSLKSKVMAHAAAAQMAANVGYDAEVIGCNRLVLLHGPPGTGKTTFCKALAQKLAIRSRRKVVQFDPVSGAAHLVASSSAAASPSVAATRPPSCRFLDLNSHSLFSKWFSESGKLVHALFDSIIDALRDDPALRYYILVDEVESLASQRGLAGTSDPQDAVRAGNAVLNELDRLKSYPNAMVLCTSNLTNMIDTAFGDRADIMQFIPPPTREARYQILASQVQEMMRRTDEPHAPIRNDIAGLDSRAQLLSYKQLRRADETMAASTGAASASASSFASASSSAVAAASPVVSPEFLVSQQLSLVAASCPSVGGRLLRRAPVRALADWNAGRPGVPLPLSRYLARLEATLRREMKEAQRMHNSKHTPTAATATTKAAASASSSSSAAAAAAAAAPIDSDTPMN